MTSAQREDVALALVLTITLSVLPRWRAFEQAWARDFAGLRALSWDWYASIIFVSAALLLALSAPYRSGLRAGSIHEHWRGVLAVCAGAVLVTAVVFPQLPCVPGAVHRSRL